MAGPEAEARRGRKAGPTSTSWRHGGQTSSARSSERSIPDVSSVQCFESPSFSFVFYDRQVKFQLRHWGSFPMLHSLRSLARSASYFLPGKNAVVGESSGGAEVAHACVHSMLWNRTEELCKAGPSYSLWAGLRTHELCVLNKSGRCYDRCSTCTTNCTPLGDLYRGWFTIFIIHVQASHLLLCWQQCRMRL